MATSSTRCRIGPIRLSPVLVEAARPAKMKPMKDDDIEEALDHDRADDGESRDGVAPAEEIARTSSPSRAGRR